MRHYKEIREDFLGGKLVGQVLSMGSDRSAQSTVTCQNVHRASVKCSVREDEVEGSFALLGQRLRSLMIFYFLAADRSVVDCKRHSAA